MTDCTRYLYVNSKAPLLDPHGLLIVDEGEYYLKSLFTMKQVRELPGGILLGEGGMGKTTFWEQVIEGLDSSKLIKLGEFPQEDLKDELTSSRDYSLLILDGLDEVPGSANRVLKYIENKPDSQKLWISSRYIPAIEPLSTKLNKVLGNKEGQEDRITYGISPLSRDDIGILARGKKINPDQFFLEAESKKILSLCSKPLVCGIVLDYYKTNGFKEHDFLPIWKNGIEILCKENPSVSRKLINKSQSDYPVADIFLASKNLALFLLLTHKKSLTLDDAYKTITKETSPELIKECLNRSLFQADGAGNYRFSHQSYFEYLAACGLKSFGLKNQKSVLLNQDHSAVSSDRQDIAAWLACMAEEFRTFLRTIQPQILLKIPDAVTQSVKDDLLKDVLDKPAQQSTRPNDWIDYSVLKTEKTSEILRPYLNTSTSSEQILLAIEIASQCGCSDLYSEIEDYILQEEVPYSHKVQATRSLVESPHRPQSCKLMQLFDYPIFSEDKNEILGGLILEICHSSLEPVDWVTYLKVPDKSLSLGEGYWNFLYHTLPDYLVKNPLHSKQLLSWAIEILKTQSKHSAVFRLSLHIYFHAFRICSDESEIIKLLAEGYNRLLQMKVFPFRQSSYDLPMTAEEFYQKQETRLAVYKELVQIEEPILDVLYCYGDFCLIKLRDLPELTKQYQSIAPEYMSIWLTGVASILTNISLENIETYQSEITALHNLDPGSIPSVEDLRTRAQKAEEEHRIAIEQDLKSEEERKKEIQDKNQQIIDRAICLLRESLEPERAFFDLSNECFFSQDRKFEIDITKTVFWNHLDLKQQNCAVDIAARFLEAGSFSQLGFADLPWGLIHALTTLRLLSPGSFSSLKSDDWERMAYPLLRFRMQKPGHPTFWEPIFDAMEKFPETLAEAFRSLIDKQEFSLLILREWGIRLSDSQFNVIFEYARTKLNPIEYSKLLSEIYSIGNGNYAAEIESYLEKLFECGWDTPHCSSYHGLRVLALELSPEKFCPTLIQLIHKSKDQWLINFFNDYMPYSLFKDVFLGHLNPEELADLFLWLAKRDSPKDEVWKYNSESYCFSILSKLMDGRTDKDVLALAKIQNEFPNSYELDKRIENLRLAILDQPIDMSEEEVRNWLQDPKKRVLNSSKDLQDWILEILNRYQEYLQNRSAIKDLWNFGRDDENDKISPLGPKIEEDFSDHLKRYLDLVSNGSIFVNREVQISRPTFAGGERGSRLDLQIEAFGETGNQLQVIIEVKCDWNKGVKSSMKEQLAERYLSQNPSAYGIYLLAWFQDMKKGVCQWKEIDTARQELEKQALDLTNKGYQISAFVVDCRLR